MALKTGAKAKDSPFILPLESPDALTWALLGNWLSGLSRTQRRKGDGAQDPEPQGSPKSAAGARGLGCGKDRLPVLAATLLTLG